MRMNQIISESEQLDELSAGDVGRAVGKGIGGVAKGLGAIPGALVGAGQAFKQGYQQARGTVSGQEPPQPQYYDRTPARTTASRAPSARTAEPQAGAGGEASQEMNFAKNIEAELDRAKAFDDALYRRLLTNLSNDLRDRQSGLTSEPEAEEPAAGGAEPAEPTTTSQPKPQRNQIITGPDGKPYQWLGAQWALYNPTTNKAGMTASKAVGDQLTQLVASGRARPFAASGATPPAGRPINPSASNVPPPPGRPISAREPEPAAAPAQAKTAEQEWEDRMRAQGLSDEEIERARGPYRARQQRTVGRQDPEGPTLGAGRPARRDTDYDWNPGGGIGPNTRLSDIGPEGERTRGRRPASESFHSRFLGKEI